MAKADKLAPATDATGVDTTAGTALAPADTVTPSTGHGQGGLYVVKPDGTRELLERTADAAPATDTPAAV